MSNFPLQINLNQQLVDLSVPVVMGIVNVTPDSFYKGSRFASDRSVLHAVESMVIDGAKIIDVGGYSTRPQAELISQEEEIRRLSEGLEAILKRFPDILISVDTFRSGVARHVVNNYRVAMINDVGGGTLDDLMFETIADLQVAYVLMHMRGNPQSMQSLTLYDDIASEVLHFLERKLAQLRLLGVKDVVVDPGFGFAKDLDQNYTLLSKLAYFKQLNVPVLAGLSRKSMLSKLLGIDASEALNATTAANMLALIGGASILRVHDVKEAVQAVEIYKKYIETK
ncbi:Dihydropteroate synthase [Paludibacter propionicigenes WB4]|uniref:dihydropteroate synthase n=1 Tax=Paludibacter propionicigenes (strain DSM 17365 / JCM 13257 / WB4) TaxID=694427 RepID=E4T5R9_PALPW|nr:dihydropteroate synthase [Paludibacter propionicigenes]ADQ80063.1 Dihydropteroate synthase [Paludibacter propionicigenes WB4]